MSVSFISIILLPKLSISYNDNKVQHSNYIKYGLQVSLVLSVVSTVILYKYSYLYSQIVYGSGLNNNEIIVISKIISIGIISLPFQALNLFIIAVYNSRGETKIPMIINILGVFVFYFILKLNFFDLTIDNIMWSLVAVYIVNFFFLFLFFNDDNFFLYNVFEDVFFISSLVLGVFIFVFLSDFLINISSFLSIIFIVSYSLLWFFILMLGHRNVRIIILEKLKNV